MSFPNLCCWVPAVNFPGCSTVVRITPIYFNHVKMAMDGRGNYPGIGDLLSHHSCVYYLQVIGAHPPSNVRSKYPTKIFCRGFIPRAPTQGLLTRGGTVKSCSWGGRGHPKSFLALRCPVFLKRGVVSPSKIFRSSFGALNIWTCGFSSTFFEWCY